MNENFKKQVPLLRLEKVSKRFQGPDAELEILRDFTLDIEAGEFLSIQGASGIGKSTLLHIMGLLDNPTEGSVHFKGERVSSLSDKKLSEIRNRDIGFIFQFHHLMPDLTALENVMLPARIRGISNGANEEETRRILKLVGVDHRLGHYPTELSGGERQRIALARALVNRPALLLADEPSGNLDEENTEILHNLLLNIHESLGTTIVLVTHDRELASIAEKSYHMVGGLIEPL